MDKLKSQWNLSCLCYERWTLFLSCLHAGTWIEFIFCLWSWIRNCSGFFFFFFLGGILFSFLGGGRGAGGGGGGGPACVILFRGSSKWPQRQLNIPFILFIKEIQSLKRWSNWLTGMTVKPTKFNLILSSTTYRAYKLSPSTRQPCSLHLIQMEMKPSVIVLSDFTISINPA